MQKEIDAVLSAQPNLKAREIAKKIGIERKRVTLFLHENQDAYVQNEEYRWSLVDKGEVLITLPCGWVTSDDFEACLMQAGCVLTSSCGCIVFVMPSGCNLMIEATAKLLALANQLVGVGKVVKLDFTDCANTKSYLNRAGFFDQLDRNVQVLPKRPRQSAAKRYNDQSEALVEFGAIDPQSKNKELVTRLTKKFVTLANEQYTTAVLTIFGELIGNVFDHSQTSVPGFAGLQRYRGKRAHIQTVVSDSGLGIAKTLRPSLEKFHPSLFKRYAQESLESDVGLIIEVMKKGEVSRFGEGRGLGFKSSREQATKFDAQFSVRQERFNLTFIFQNGVLINVRKQLDLPRIMGTHICFDFFL